jgi:hypothetical protein
LLLLLKLEMERALLDVEHSNELKSIQNDEAKLKHLQQEHQVRLENFNLHTNQVEIYIEKNNVIIKNFKIYKKYLNFFFA